ncbi:MAG: NPCBM/NEW2 domain-containing protein [Planctomycetes bacterium]|nr:NPCBM/NEW2 domain-containing protein [Planctomycetota bacterium]
MSASRFVALTLVLWGAALRAQDAIGEIRLASLDLSVVRQGWGVARADRSVTGQPLGIAGQRFEHGVGTHARSQLWLELDGRALAFTAMVGVDDGTTSERASVVFAVWGDGKKLWESGVMRRGQPAKAVEVDLRAMTRLLLQVGDAGDGIDFDHADWAEARLRFTGATPRAIAPPQEAAVILTPPPPSAPRIHGPKVLGCRPGNPFLHRIPATGERPMRFVAEGLPDTLRLDASTGIVSGTAPPRGTHRVVFVAGNDHGEDRRALRIESGDAICLTPPMGWNHWYAHYDRITDEMVRQAADAMVRSGMADVGYQYVNIDDCWMNAASHRDPQRVGPARDERGAILPNARFPDMSALTAHIHSLGLKAGIYTSPGPRTCAGFTGSHGHEAEDARSFAAWGFDFVKYDWCSYGEVALRDGGTAALQAPYRLMGGILRELPRDVVFNLCQYGMGEVWEWGADVHGHCWRTAGDLGFELDRVFEVALANVEHRQWSKPGAFNDPDYLQIGMIGDARSGGEPRPCPLSPNEQYSFMSLWCLMAAPLIYSGDMRQLDPFTLNVLCNPELIDVDQDPLGQCARHVPLGDESFALVKDLEDGNVAVGLFQRGEFDVPLSVAWTTLGLEGPLQVRDLWRQQALGTLASGIETVVGRRGVVMLRVRKPAADRHP